jgi:hypothetical protein
LPLPDETRLDQNLSEIAVGENKGLVSEWRWGHFFGIMKHMRVKLHLIVMFHRMSSDCSESINVETYLLLKQVMNRVGDSRRATTLPPWVAVRVASAVNQVNHKTSSIGNDEAAQR